ncbi:Nucleoside-diphosphate-sugar epimerase [Eubacterium maltosivorans]|uniref:NAD-dependent epimerase/dehydratase family protein n=1 Tax=Eubacterium maltosivorans TaxID=2041044 RepID=UPI000890B474|nr:NAD(P)-dependent oxidoreductase [Eubacterium maltosivorans]WPK80053.1 CDP-abequose synthase [Eubacterium maltosivorans]SDP87446.1 Nucleoside-diphosphate-sugar epimerase [Eubacterium maltosivorans]
MKILITGATGYVGKQLLKKLLKNDNLGIVALVRDIKKAKESLKTSKIQYICSKDQQWKNQVQQFNPEIVIHLAAYLTSNDDESSIEKLINANITFGSQLLEALKKCDLKLFVNTGTFAEYDQDYSLSPSYYYAATKTAFRSVLKYYQKLNSFKILHAIPYTIYGREHEGKKVMDYLFEAQNKEIKMTLGEQKLDFIHVDDVIRFYDLVIKHYNEITENEEVMFLGTGNGTTIREVANIIEELCHRKLHIIWGGLQYRPSDVMYAVAPIEKNHLSFWRANISLKQGIVKYWEQ